MLEILLVWALAKKIGGIVAAKGHSRFGYQLLLVALWIGGELAGGVIGVLVQGAAGGEEQGFPCMAYICALLGAAAGAGIAFAIANGLANVKTDADFYRDDNYDRRRDEEVRRAWHAPQDRPPDSDAYKSPPAEREPDDRIQE